MKYLKKADAELAKSGWHWDWEQMQTIQEVVERTTGEQTSLEQVDALLGFLSSQRLLKEDRRKTAFLKSVKQ